MKNLSESIRKTRGHSSIHHSNPKDFVYVKDYGIFPNEYEFDLKIPDIETLDTMEIVNYIENIIFTKIENITGWVMQEWGISNEIDKVPVYIQVGKPTVSKVAMYIFNEILHSGGLDSRNYDKLYRMVEEWSGETGTDNIQIIYNVKKPNELRSIKIILY